MSVHYKFKSTLNFDTISFDGLHISVADLKRGIMQQKKLGKMSDFDLQITNAQTKEEYREDSTLIPKNTTLIISRVPITQQLKKGWDANVVNDCNPAAALKEDASKIDLFQMPGSEEDKIQAMIAQSTAEYDPKTYQKIRGHSQVGDVPLTYRCNKCKKGGHWIRNCPFNITKEYYDVKRTTGIPRSFRDKPDTSVLSESTLSNSMDEAKKKQEVPDDLVCSICQDLYVDAVMIPCCGSSFCDDCVRTALLESEDNECPDCKEKGCSPGSLIPNRFLRNSVNAFKNETGYKSAFQMENQSGQKQVVSKCPKPEDQQTNQSEEVVISELTKPIKEEKTEEAKVTCLASDIDNKKKEQKVICEQDPVTVYNSGESRNQSNSFNVQNCPKVMISQPLNASSTRRFEGSNINESGSMRIKNDSNPEEKTMKFHIETNIVSSTNMELKPVKRENNSTDCLDNANHRQIMNLFKPVFSHQACGLQNRISHPIASYNNGYNDMSLPPPINYAMYQNHPHVADNMRSIYSPNNLELKKNMSFPRSNLDSIYQGVAAKVGTGVIEDPLEAFNRIMREKEKQKEERRRSPGNRKPRSPERTMKTRFRSSPCDRSFERDFLEKDKRERHRDTFRNREQVQKHRYVKRGSHSPLDKRIRLHSQQQQQQRQQIFSPKPKYSHKTKESSIIKNKKEYIEPPPPGFEAIQTNNLVRRDIENDEKCLKAIMPKNAAVNLNYNNDLQGANSPNNGYSKEVNKEIENADKNERSFTPQSFRTLNQDLTEELSIIKDKHIKKSQQQKDYLDRTNSEFGITNQQTNLFDKKKLNYDSEDKDEKKSKDHKRKKKIKPDRKKNKKEKKDKRGKREKKSISPAFSKSSEKSYIKSEKDLIKHIDSEQFSNDGRQKFENVALSAKNMESDIETTKTQIVQSKNIISPKPTDMTYTNSNSNSNKGFSVNFEEFNEQSINKQNNLNAQISKWEREENVVTNEKLVSNNESQMSPNVLITSDVIRKAENAIFARAINAIRPLELKITIPSGSANQEVREKDSVSPKATTSIKDRLGSKIVRKRTRSPSQTRGRNEILFTKDRKCSFYKKDRFNNIDYKNGKKEGSRMRTKVLNEMDRYRHFNDVFDSSENLYNYGGKSFISRRDTEKEFNRRPDGIKKQERFKVSSVASKPSRHENPFRKFERQTFGNTKHNNPNNFVNSEPEDVASLNEEKRKKRKRDKKLKKRENSSSTESVNTDKAKQVKHKKKKSVKKKKKSKK